MQDNKIACLVGSLHMDLSYRRKGRNTTRPMQTLELYFGIATALQR